MRALKSTVPPTAFVLVDDVITRGATMIAAAARLRDLYPDIPIAAFAIARTSNEFQGIKVPCLGEVTASEIGSWSRRHDLEFPSPSK